MNFRIFLIAGVLAGGCFWPGLTRAEEATVGQLQRRLEALEQKCHDQDGCLESYQKNLQEQQRLVSAHEQKLALMDEVLHRQTGAPVAIAPGLELSLAATMILQSAQPQARRTDATQTYDLAFSKNLEQLEGNLFLHLEAGQGAGLDDVLGLYSGVNRDAGNERAIHVSEAWYAQKFMAGRLAVCLGYLDPSVYFDGNAAANDETTQFIAFIFRNNPTIEFTDNTAGLRMELLPLEWLEIGYGIFVGNEDWQQVGAHLFQMGQLTFRCQVVGPPGNFRLWAWHNQNDHSRWLDADLLEEASWGYGVSMDQALEGGVVLFGRWGRCDPAVFDPGMTFALEPSWSAGVSLAGRAWGREADTMGAAVGQAIPSRDYQRAGETLEPQRRAAAEGHAEFYYRWCFNPHWSLSPDVQYVWNPFGLDRPEATEAIWVWGLRAQVDF